MIWQALVAKAAEDLAPVAGKADLTAAFLEKSSKFAKNTGFSPHQAIPNHLRF